MTRESRIDRVRMRLDERALQLDDRGYARVSGTIISGPRVLEYGPADGHEEGRREFVPQETIEDADAIASLMFAPVTLGHPPRLLDSGNTQRFQVGTVIDANAADATLTTEKLLTDAQALSMIESGVIELSAGYTADIDESPGEFGGRAYDAIQRSRRYNHVAIVPNARAGSDSRLHLDSVRGALAAPGLRVQIPDEEHMAQITIGDETVDVPDEAAAAFIQSLQNTDEPAADAGDDDEEMDANAAPAPTPTPTPVVSPAPSRGDGSSLAEVRSMLAKIGLGRDGDLAEHVADVLETRQTARSDAADRRAALVARAKPLMDESWRCDGKTDDDIMWECIKHVDPDLEAIATAARGDSARLGGLFEGVLALASRDRPGHALGDEAVAGGDRADARSAPGVGKRRADMAQEVFRTQKLIGREAMMTPEMQGLRS